MWGLEPQGPPCPFDHSMERRAQRLVINTCRDGASRPQMSYSSIKSIDESIVVNQVSKEIHLITDTLTANAP